MSAKDDWIALAQQVRSQSDEYEGSESIVTVIEDSLERRLSDEIDDSEEASEEIAAQQAELRRKMLDSPESESAELRDDGDDVEQEQQRLRDRILGGR
ncbi:MAG: hypothetical protein ABEI77_06620 [Halorientalis sp.]